GAAGSRAAAAGAAGDPPPLGRGAAPPNTPLLGAKANGEPRYRAAQDRQERRKIDSRLWLFDFINGDKVVPVCPNDANFVYETGVHRAEYHNYALKAGGGGGVEGGV